MCVPHIKCKINGDVWIIYSIGQDLKQNKSGDFIQSHMEGTEAPSKN